MNTTPGYTLIDNADLQQWFGDLFAGLMKLHVNTYNISYGAAFTAWLYNALRLPYNWYIGDFRPVDISGWGAGILEIIKGWGGQSPPLRLFLLRIRMHRNGRNRTSWQHSWIHYGQINMPFSSLWAQQHN